jgi:adenylyltransferase/sulfurtransferase
LSADLDPIRYSRHLLLPEIGPQGQQRLHDACVAVVGLGGLGCPAALYLAAAGIGRLRLIDPDVVSLANLQRQILYSTAEVGQPKAATAAARLRNLNPDVTVEVVASRLQAENARELLAGADVIVDGSDNFPTRYLTSDYAVLTGKPVVFGALERFQGQVTVLHPGTGGPCYRCLHPDLPPAGAVPTCDEAGVLGVLPGLIGTLQAAEAMKVILQIGQPLIGRMLLLDVLRGTSRTVAFRRNSLCSACGDHPVIDELRDEVWACSSGSGGRIGSVEEVDGPQFLEWLRTRAGDLMVVDVRRPDETAGGVVPGAVLVPLDQIEGEAERLSAAAGERTVVLYCARGARSLKAAHLLAPVMGRVVHSLRGGMETYLATGGLVVPPAG